MKYTPVIAYNVWLATPAAEGDAGGPSEPVLRCFWSMQFIRPVIRRAVLVSAWLAALVVSSANAQEYPRQPVTLIVPYAAGGSSDTLARSLGEAVARSLGQPLVIDNKPGGGTVIGTLAAKRAPADGHTLLMNAASSVINPSLMPRLAYDIRKDFVPVALLASNPHVLVTSTQVPASDLKAFLAWARAREGAATYASFGNGSSGHLGFERFKKEAGIDLIHVPYKGVAPATSDLLGGQVDAMLSDLAQVLPYIKVGKLKALAVAGETRSVELPQVPTFGEAGLAGFTSQSWFGLLVRAGTPPSVVVRLNAEFNKALRDPAVRAKLVPLGMEPIGSTPAQFANFMTEQAKKYAEIVKFSGVRLD